MCLVGVLPVAGLPRVACVPGCGLWLTVVCQAGVLADVPRVAFVPGCGPDRGPESCLCARLWPVADSGVPGWGPGRGPITIVIDS